MNEEITETFDPNIDLFKNKNKSANKYENEYPKLNESEDSCVSDDDEPIKNSKTYFIKPTLHQMFITLLLFIFNINFGLCCELTYFISSSGKICNDLDCITMPITQFSVATNSIICFRNSKDDNIEISLEESYNKLQYYKVYETSDFEIKTIYHSDCKGDGNCWSNGCHLESRSNHLNKFTNNQTIQGFGCDSDTIGCNYYCFHQSSCVWYKWFLHPVGIKYNIYKLISHAWEVRFKVSSKLGDKLFILNVNNPMSEFIMPIKNNENVKVSMYVNSFNSEFNYLDNGGVVLNNKFTMLDVSESSFPQSNKIGDYQHESLTNTSSFDISSVNCQVNSCEVKCKFPLSTIKKLSNYVKLKRSHSKFYYKNNDYNVELRHDVLATVFISTINIEVDNLYIKVGECILNIIDTYACLSCDQMPYVIYQSTKIKNNGLMPFESNCTFKRYLIPCEEQLNTLTLDTDNDYCMIYTKINNQTYYVNFEYKFLGTLLYSGLGYSQDDTYGNIISIIKNPGLLEGMYHAIASITVVSICYGILTKLIRLWTLRSNKATIDNIESDDKR